MDYIKRLTELRIDNDYSQTVIAKYLGCKQTAISKYELGQRLYKVTDIVKLCKLYNVSADYLFGLPEDMPYPKRRGKNTRSI